ncbi:MAG: cupin domain-containing protein [Pseudomonadota bacterium]
MTVSMEDMERRLVRYAELDPCTNAFIDTNTPGSDQKENFCIIGPGVTENPHQTIHIQIPHGFNIGAARQPAGCVNSQHSHLTEEVFLVHTGVWAFRWGHDGKDGEVVLHPGDVISIPVDVFRGFECVEGDGSFLFGVLGGDDPGHVTWAPYVFDEAKQHGLVLTKAGRVIDTAKGETIPEGDEPCIPTSMDNVASFRRITHEEMSARVVSKSEQTVSLKSKLAQHSSGVLEAALLGPESPAEGVDAAKVDDRHGFQFRKLSFESNGRIPPHSRAEEEVVFVHDGAVTLFWGSNFVELTVGDTITVPKGLVRSWWATGGAPATLFVVRGGDAPAAPKWVDDKTIAETQSAEKIAS